MIPNFLFLYSSLLNVFLLDCKLRHTRLPCSDGSFCRKSYDSTHFISHIHPFIKPCSIGCQNREESHRKSRSHICPDGAMVCCFYIFYSFSSTGTSSFFDLFCFFESMKDVMIKIIFPALC